MKRWFVLGLTLLCVAACGGGSVPEPTVDSVATQLVAMKAAAATLTAEAPTATQTATLVPTATPTPTVTPTPVPTTAPTPELMPGPEGWILHESEELNVAIYHPPDWTATLEISEAEDGGTVEVLTVSGGEAPSLMIGDRPDLGGTSAEQWADQVLPRMNADTPGAFELKLKEPFTTLDGGDGAVVVVQSTQFSVGAFQSVAIYEETAFVGAALMLGGPSDEENIVTYKSILETLQRR